MPDDQKPQTTAVSAARERAVVIDSGLFENMMDTSRFEHLQRVSKVFANSSLVPQHFQGKEADCFIAVEMAMRLKLHPFNLMQSLYVVHGKPGIEAKMAIALINSSGIFEGPLQWTVSGDGMKRQAVARAVHARTKQVCEAVVTMEMAKAEGWIDKSGSKWKTLPDLMLQYRSASFFARLYCPEVLFGMQTKEELDDTPLDITPAAEQPAPKRAASLKERVGATVSGESARVPEPVVSTGGTPYHADDLSERIKTASPAAQEPAGAAQETEPPPPPTGESEAPQKPAQQAPAIPFADVMTMAKKAKTRDQGDIVLDALNGEGYTEEQRAEVKTILNSKKYAE
jgi:hypothetical protein